jgi:hypothetical protein
MRTVTVNKTDLVKKLRENRTQHAGKVNTARGIYRQKVVAELEIRLEQAKNGRDIDPGFLHLLPIPRDYTEEYDRALAVCEWEVGAEIQLTQEDFNRYVLDQWEWHQAFAASTAVYLAE